MPARISRGWATPLTTFVYLSDISWPELLLWALSLAMPVPRAVGAGEASAPRAGRAQTLSMRYSRLSAEAEADPARISFEFVNTQRPHAAALTWRQRERTASPNLAL